MNNVFGVIAITTCLLTGSIAFAGNCATHSAEKVKCDLAGKSWDEASSSCNDASA